MPRIKTKPAIKTEVPAIKTEVKEKSFKWTDSYISLLLGLVVVLVIIGVLIAAFRGGRGKEETSSIQDKAAVEETDEGVEATEAGKKVYTVKAGDHLWKIAQKFYKDGYKWVEIAKANNLQKPNLILTGNKLTIPDLKTQEEVKQERLTEKESEAKESEKTKESTAKEEPKKQPDSKDAITANSYTVVKGDHLWKIAVRAYGDGYKWVDIARANKLSNPNLIFSGNIFKIPR